MIGTIDYTSSVNFNPTYLQSVFNLIFWLLIVILIIISSIYLVVIIQVKRNQKKGKGRKFSEAFNLKNIYNNMNMARKNSESSTAIIRKKSIDVRERKDPYKAALIRFTIIIFVYLLQWTGPCFITVLNPLCNNCVPLEVSLFFYWLTYTVCFTGNIQF